MSDTALAADVAVIGGSGLYSLFEDAPSVLPETPFGLPSAPISIAEVSGRRVAFLPRHGADHEYPPHTVPYRANLFALHELGVRQVVAPCAVGSLRPDLTPGALVIPDQLVDRTTSRTQSFFDRFDGASSHVSFADPYCQPMRGAALTIAKRQNWSAVDGGTMVVIEGPRFSTRAESLWYAAQGWSLVNMTGHPEAVLARELKICYCPLALVTDLDAGLVTGAGVSEAEVFAVFAAHIGRMRELLVELIGELPEPGRCNCT